MKSVFILLFLTIASPLMAQNVIDKKESFIYENWELIREVSGDLNKDTLADVAMILQYAGDALENERPRMLIILFQDKATKLYQLAASARHVILGADMGGMLGDPFSNMEIKNNVLRIDFFGGSREKWETTHRYRFTADAYFRLIGATYKSMKENITETYDYNLSNGNIIVTTRDSENKAKNKTVNKRLLLQPITIEQFEPDAIWSLLIPEFGKKVEKCKFLSVEVGDCFHLEFDCGDFGNAKLFLDEASAKLWTLVADENGDSIENPAYRGKTFEITYITNTGTQCDAQGEDTYQLVIGFKQI